MRLLTGRFQLWHKAPGIRHGPIAELSCAVRRTVQRTLDLYAGGGLEAVRHVSRRVPVKALAAYRMPLAAEFKARPPADLGGSAGTPCQVDEPPAQYNASGGISTRGIGLTLP